MNRGKLIKKEEFSKLLIYISWIAIALSFIIVVLTFLLIERRILLLTMLFAAAMEFLGGVFFRTLHRSDLYIYENGIKIPKAKADIWNNVWGLPERDFIPYSDISKIYAKIGGGFSGQNGIFLEMVDGREVILMWGSKEKLEDIAKTLNEFTDIC